jgi:hypothetical protein
VRLRLSPFATPLFILPLLGCQTIIGAEFDSAQLAPSKPSCQPARPPVRPAHLPSATDSVDFTVVIDQLDFGDMAPDAGKSRPVGYDQDGVCTGEDGPLSCTPYSWLDSMPEDGPGGRDDAVAELLKQQKSLFGISLIGSDEENEGTVAGLGAPTGILRVRDFSGLASDDHVTVELFQAAAYSLAEPPVGPDAVPKRPSFDASDHWPVVRASLEADGASPLESTQRDDDAFVIDNTLVAHFDMLQLPMHNVYVEAMQVAFTASLHYSAASGWTVRDGTLAGKIRTDFLLGFVPLATRSAVNVSLCTDDALNYKLAKTLLCQTADLPAEKGNRKSPCAFASVGVNFQSSPASLGPVVDVLPQPSPCPPLTDPANDHCSLDPSDQ